MSPTHAITVNLAPAEYERLEAAAQRRGLPPEELARTYVAGGLASEGETEADRRRREGLAALDRLDALPDELRRDGYPSVDAVAIARQSREGLEQRSEVRPNFHSYSG